MQNTNYHGESAAMRAAASPSRSSYLFIYLFTCLSIYFLHLIRSLHSSRAIYDHRQYRMKKGKKKYAPNVQNNSSQLVLAARGYQVILWRLSLVVIDVGSYEEAGGIFEIFNMTNHLPSRLYFDLWWTIFCKKKNRRQKQRSSVADQERERWGLGRGQTLKRYPISEKVIGFRLLTA